MYTSIAFVAAKANRAFELESKPNTVFVNPAETALILLLTRVFPDLNMVVEVVNDPESFLTTAVLPVICITVPFATGEF